MCCQLQRALPQLPDTVERVTMQDNLWASGITSWRLQQSVDAQQWGPNHSSELHSGLIWLPARLPGYLLIRALPDILQLSVLARPGWLLVAILDQSKL